MTIPFHDYTFSLVCYDAAAMSTGRTFVEMEELVSRLVDAREACLTKNNAPPAIEVCLMHVTMYRGISPTPSWASRGIVPKYRRSAWMYDE